MGKELEQAAEAVTFPTQGCSITDFAELLSDVVGEHISKQQVLNWIEREELLSVDKQEKQNKSGTTSQVYWFNESHFEKAQAIYKLKKLGYHVLEIKAFFAALDHLDLLRSICAQNLDQIISIFSAVFQLSELEKNVLLYLCVERKSVAESARLLQVPEGRIRKVLGEIDKKVPITTLLLLLGTN